MGNFVFSPNDKNLSYAAALNINDHAVSQVYTIDLEKQVVNNLTPPDFQGHVSWVNWKSNKEVMYYSGEGVWPKLSIVPLKGGKRKVILDSESSGIIFSTPEYTSDFKHFIFTRSTPKDPSNIYYWNVEGSLRRLTDINPFLADRTLGKQEIIKYKARDGAEIEGILIHPVG